MKSQNLNKKISALGLCYFKTCEAAKIVNDRLLWRIYDKVTQEQRMLNQKMGGRSTF